MVGHFLGIKMVQNGPVFESWLKNQPFKIRTTFHRLNTGLVQ
jgi:hypothetical protein